jgi:hypothetical protein
MKRKAARKKEHDSEETWYARMNALEEIWRIKINESRLEYQERFMRISRRRPKT